MNALNARSEVSSLRVNVDGSLLAADEMSRLIDVVIEQDLVLPDMFAIRVLDSSDQDRKDRQVYFPALDADRFPIGARVQIDMGREQAAHRVLTGEITSLDLEAQSDGSPILTVRGYDLAYKLHRQRTSRTFPDMSDSDIARKIAHEHGLSADTDESGIVYEHVYQDNLTDWEFLRARANLVGFELFVDMERRALVFRRATAAASTEQAFGDKLLRLRLRLSAPAQVEEVVVRGWNPATKQEIEGRAAAPRQRAQIDGDTPRANVVRKLGSNKFVLCNQPVRSAAEADSLAQSVYDEIAGEFVQFEGVCLGDWSIRPGQSVRFKNLGKRLDHEYYLSSTRHRLAADGYTTHFTVSGRRPHTLLSLLQEPSSSRGRSMGQSRHHGVVIGLVTNNKDDQHGRVKVRFPWLGQEESHWARIASPMAGNARGFHFLPEVGDEVLVAFEHGDINHPYVLGGLWNGREKPPRNASDVVGPTGKVNQRSITSRLGHTITLDDSDEHPSISIVDKTGNNHLRLDSSTNALHAKVQGDLTLEAQGQITISGSRGVSIRSQANADIQAADNLEIKATLVEIN
jgi:Rhs element Vgr protein